MRLRTTTVILAMTSLVALVGLVVNLYPAEIRLYRFPILVGASSAVIAAFALKIMGPTNENANPRGIGGMDVLLFSALPLEIILFYFMRLAQNEIVRTIWFWLSILLAATSVVHLAAVGSQAARYGSRLHFIARPKRLAILFASVQAACLYFAFPPFYIEFPGPQQIPLLAIGYALVASFMLRALRIWPRRVRGPVWEGIEGLSFVVGFVLLTAQILFIGLSPGPDSCWPGC